ncbi:MAG: glucose dehydrogenase, partial [Chloroflexota bacterium]|nr:glucose dehydrogenase [Chloroflexota bacterium]
MKAQTGGVATVPAPTAPFNAAAISLSLSRVASGLSSPVFVTNAGDASGRLFIVEQRGTIKILQGGVVL